MQTACLPPAHAWETLVRVVFGVEGKLLFLSPSPSSSTGLKWCRLGAYEEGRVGSIHQYINFSGQ